MSGNADDLDALTRGLGNAEPSAPTEGGLVGTSELIRRLAEIEDELERSGANALLAEREDLRDRLKKLMMSQQTARAVDEVSQRVAEVTATFSDVWHPDVLEPLLTPTQRVRCIVKAVSVAAVAELIKLGALSRAALEAAGAVTKKPRSVSLRVKKLGDESNDLG